jgi:prepilin-type N-terminal cleavage/methylation domain-containing protein
MRGNKLLNILCVKNKKGFSLIEMMVALGILSLIIIGLVTFFSGGTRAWVTGRYQLEAQRNARFSMDRMVKEIREGKNITSGSETSITVSVPHFDVDGDIDSYYSVTYDLNDTTIQRDTNPLIDNVLKIAGEDIFKYYDSVKQYIPNDSDPDINLLNNISKISKIHINLKVDVDKDDSPDITLNADVDLRNFGFNNY